MSSSDFTVDRIPSDTPPMRISDYFIGKTVCSIVAGQKLGKVKDVYFDANCRGMAAVSLGSRGVLNRQPAVVPVTQIIVVGRDIALIYSPEDLFPVHKDEATKGWIPWSSLHGRTILAHGIEVAVLDDVVVDENLSISGLTFTQVLKGCTLKSTTIAPVAIVMDYGGPAGRQIKVDLDLLAP